MKRSAKRKTRSAWLITWESSREDYFRDLGRPRVVAILKPQYKRNTINHILRALYTSDTALTFSEKIGYSFGSQSPSFLREDDYSISCGGNPWLCARLVKDLYVQSYPDTVWRETLHWTEHARTREDPKTFEFVVTVPERQCCEDMEFDRTWYGRSFLEDDAKANQTGRGNGG